MNPAAVDVAFNERLRRHEAAHAAAALTLGLDVHEVWAGTHNVTDLTEDSEGAAGRTLIDAPNTPDGYRLTAISIMAGPLEDRQAGWPRPWPLPRVDLAPDEWLFSENVRAAGLDEHGYQELVNDAYDVITSPPYKRAHAAIEHALAAHPRLDSHAVQRIKQIAIEGAQVQHMTKAAATVTATDQGEFTAIAAAWTVDRQGDQIHPGAFAQSIARWQASGKRVPLHWNHQGDAHNVIGSLDPATMRETDDGLYVEGQLDLQDSDTAREAWRSMRNGSMSLSFGFLATKTRKRDDGIQDLLELDLFEVSIVPSPANADTRVLSMKALDPEADRIRAEYASLMTNLLGGPASQQTKPKALDLKAIERDLQVETFPC